MTTGLDPPIVREPRQGRQGFMMQVGHEVSNDW